MRVLYYVGSIGIFMWLGILGAKWVGNPIDMYKLTVFTLVGVALVSVRDYCMWKLKDE